MQHRILKEMRQEVVERIHNLRIKKKFQKIMKRRKQRKRNRENKAKQRGLDKNLMRVKGVGKMVAKANKSKNRRNNPSQSQNSHSRGDSKQQHQLNQQSSESKFNSEDEKEFQKLKEEVEFDEKLKQSLLHSPIKAAIRAERIKNRSLHYKPNKSKKLPQKAAPVLKNKKKPQRKRIIRVRKLKPIEVKKGELPINMNQLEKVMSVYSHSGQREKLPKEFTNQKLAFFTQKSIKMKSHRSHSLNQAMSDKSDLTKGGNNQLSTDQSHGQGSIDMQQIQKKKLSPSSRKSTIVASNLDSNLSEMNFIPAKPVRLSKFGSPSPMPELNRPQMSTPKNPQAPNNSVLSRLSIDFTSKVRKSKTTINFPPIGSRPHEHSELRKAVLTRKLTGFENYTPKRVHQQMGTTSDDYPLSSNSSMGESISEFEEEYTEIDSNSADEEEFYTSEVYEDLGEEDLEYAEGFSERNKISDKLSHNEVGHQSNYSHSAYSEGEEEYLTEQDSQSFTTSMSIQPQDLSTFEENSQQSRNLNIPDRSVRKNSFQRTSTKTNKIKLKLRNIVTSGQKSKSKRTNSKKEKGTKNTEESFPQEKIYYQVFNRVPLSLKPSPSPISQKSSKPSFRSYLGKGSASPSSLGSREMLLRNKLDKIVEVKEVDQGYKNKRTKKSKFINSSLVTDRISNKTHSFQDFEFLNRLEKYKKLNNTMNGLPQQSLIEGKNKASGDEESTQLDSKTLGNTLN